MKVWLDRAADGLLGLLYPRRAQCMGCGSRAGLERDWLCEDCRQELANRWVGAAAPPEGGLFEGAAYGYVYGGPASGLVRALKYHGVWRLADGMAGAMLRALEGLQPVGADCVVPVPMHPKRLKERGYNHAALLASRVAEGLALPCVEALQRTRNTRQQARLDDAQRMRNQEGAFDMDGDVAGMRVLLVDDVCTTGATANACARALLEGGAACVLLLCFAQARKD